MAPNITGWSASHSAREPDQQRAFRKGTVNGNRFAPSKIAVNISNIQEAAWLYTYGVHDGVSQHNVADVDSGDQTDETRDNIRVVHIYRLSYGLEAK